MRNNIGWPNLIICPSLPVAAGLFSGLVFNRCSRSQAMIEANDDLVCKRVAHGKKKTRDCIGARCATTLDGQI